MADGKQYAAFTRGSFYKDHNVVLQTLDRENNGLFQPLDAFAGTVNDWEGIPVIFAKDHPDMALFEENPDLALGQVGGRVVGKVRNPHIDMTGHPTLDAVLELEDDPSIERLITNGQLSPSTGYWHEGHREVDNLPVPVVQGPVRPQHVLIFVEDPTTNDVPGDKGAFIINKKTKDGEYITDDNEALGLLDKLRAYFTKEDPEPEAQAETMQEPEVVAPEEPEPTPEPASVEEAAEQASDAVTEAIGAASFDPEEGKKLAEALKTIEMLKAKLAEMEGQAAEEAATAKWVAFKQHLPEGELHGDGEATWKAAWNENPQDAALKALALKSDSPLPGEEGETFTGGVDDDGEVPVKGRWDPASQTWVEAYRY